MDPDPFLWLMDPDSEPERPKTYDPDLNPQHWLAES